MTKSTPLPDRITAALAGEPAATEVAALIAEAERERDALTNQAGEARNRSLDPHADEAAASAAREEAATLSWRAERMAKSIAVLREAHQAAKDREDLGRRRAAYDDARDALARAEAALVERWPALAGEMRDLLVMAAEASAKAIRANEALPAGAEPLVIPGAIDGTRPAAEERILGSAVVETWVDEITGQPVEERFMSTEADQLGRRVLAGSGGASDPRYAVKGNVRRVEFVPARRAERGSPIYAETTIPGLAGGVPFWTPQDGRPDPDRALAAHEERETRRAQGDDAGAVRVRHEPVAGKVTPIRPAA